jgi:hypothetical protein
MSLYTIGDLHLHFGSELKAKNQIEGKVCLRWHPMKVL